MINNEDYWRQEKFRKNGGFSASYLNQFGNLHVSDVTEENNLWNILAKY